MTFPKGLGTPPRGGVNLAGGAVHSGNSGFLGVPEVLFGRFGGGSRGPGGPFLAGGAVHSGNSGFLGVPEVLFSPI